MVQPTSLFFLKHDKILLATFEIALEQYVPLVKKIRSLKVFLFFYWQCQSSLEYSNISGLLESQTPIFIFCQKLKLLLTKDQILELHNVQYKKKTSLKKDKTQKHPCFL